jgi:hypothetical protein
VEDVNVGAVVAVNIVTLPALEIVIIMPNNMLMS